MREDCTSGYCTYPTGVFSGPPPPIPGKIHDLLSWILPDCKPGDTRSPGAVSELRLPFNRSCPPIFNSYYVVDPSLQAVNWTHSGNSVDI
jgi:hypothetical protein